MSDTGNQPHQELSNDIPSKTQGRISRSGKLALYICGVYLFLTFFPLVNLIFMMGAWAVSFFVVYIGIPLAFLVWAISMAYRVFIRKNRRSVVLTGMKYGVIVFGLMGLMIWPWGLVPPSAKTFTKGYWLHAKVWVDVEDLRNWAQKRGALSDPNEEVPWQEWPVCLRRMPMSHGTLLYNQQESTITLVEGSGFGHWGLTVAPEGTPIPDDWCVLKLEDGAWVWHEYQ